MGYFLSIRRKAFHDGSDPKGVITESQWTAAVNKVDGVRISSRKNWTVHNPKTGSVTTLAGSGADAEVYFPPKLLKGQFNGIWKKVFSWSSSGEIRFRANFDHQDRDDPVRKAAAALAYHLGAIIIGDEGETYDWGDRTPPASTMPSGPVNIKADAPTGSDWPADFIRYFSQSAGVSFEDAARFLRCYKECVIDILEKKEVVTTAIGRYQLVTRPERSGINPRTGSRVTIPGSKTLRFFPSQSLTNKLNIKK